MKAFRQRRVKCEWTDRPIDGLKNEPKETEVLLQLLSFGGFFGVSAKRSLRSVGRFAFVAHTMSTIVITTTRLRGRHYHT